jgi:hypothetical protein
MGSNFHNLTVQFTSGATPLAPCEVDVDRDHLYYTSSIGATNVGAADNRDNHKRAMGFDGILRRIIADASNGDAFISIMRTISFRLQGCLAASSRGQAGASGLRALLLCRSLVLEGPEYVISYAFDFIPVLRAILRLSQSLESGAGSGTPGAKKTSMQQQALDYMSLGSFVDPTVHATLLLDLLMDHKKVTVQRKCTVLMKRGGFPHLTTVTPSKELRPAPFHRAPDMLPRLQFQRFDVLHRSMNGLGLPCIAAGTLRLSIPELAVGAAEDRGQNEDEEDESGQGTPPPSSSSSSASRAAATSSMRVSNSAPNLAPFASSSAPPQQQQQQQPVRHMTPPPQPSSSSSAAAAAASMRPSVSRERFIYSDEDDADPKAPSAPSAPFAPAAPAPAQTARASATGTSPVRQPFTSLELKKPPASASSAAKLAPPPEAPNASAAAAASRRASTTKAGIAPVNDFLNADSDFSAAFAPSGGGGGGAAAASTDPFSTAAFTASSDPFGPASGATSSGSRYTDPFSASVATGHGDPFGSSFSATGTAAAAPLDAFAPSAPSAGYTDPFAPTAAGAYSDPFGPTASASAAAAFTPSSYDAFAPSTASSSSSAAAFGGPSPMPMAFTPSPSSASAPHDPFASFGSVSGSLPQVQQQQQAGYRSYTPPPSAAGFIYSKPPNGGAGAPPAADPFAALNPIQK